MLGGMASSMAGSMVGSVVGHSIANKMFGSDGHQEAPQEAQAAYPQEQAGYEQQQQVCSFLIFDFQFFNSVFSHFFFFATASALSKGDGMFLLFCDMVRIS